MCLWFVCDVVGKHERDVSVKKFSNQPKYVSINFSFYL